MGYRALAVVLSLTLLPSSLASAQGPAPETDHGAADAEHKRILWIIPNYRTSPTLKDYHPLTVVQKFSVAWQDARDPGTFALAGLFAAQGQLTGSAPSFGTGVSASAKYYTAASTDFVVGDFMTEAVFPSLLHQDPRYFRRGTGGGWARLGAALGQMVWTHADRGGSAVNFSEIVGNGAAVAVGNAYYRDNRSLSDNLSKLAVQLGVDAASNVLKEFAPDLDRLLSKKRRAIGSARKNVVAAAQTSKLCEGFACVHERSLRRIEAWHAADLDHHDGGGHTKDNAAIERFTIDAGTNPPR